jgi:protein-L-isoaspartate(D-aspartate) O-methyltransferase
LEVLANQLTEGSKALDVGSGSGYLSACMAIMVIFEIDINSVHD